MKPNICLDFDGVLNIYKGYQGKNVGELRPGAREFLAQLNKEYNVIIFSVRPFHEIVRWLKKYDLVEYVWNVTSQKQPAHAYIDDRALRFNGDYNETLTELETFKPYWKEDD